MQNYHKRNFLEMLKYAFFSHGASALLYIAIFSSAEAQYADKGNFDMLNRIFILISVITFAISVTLMLTSHFGNSEKKMNYLNATYEGGNEHSVALPHALIDGAEAALANLIFQIPMIVIFFNVGYRYGVASIFETFYICDVGMYILFGNPVVGALVISAAYFLVYSLGVFLVVCPMWNLGRIRKAGAPITPDMPAQDAYYRNTVGNTYKIFFVLKKLITANAVCFGIYLVFSIVFAAIVSKMEPIGISLFHGFFYALVFYGVHGFRRDGSYFPHEKRFSPIKESIAFFREELVYYLISFSVLALVCEISCFIAKARNAVVTIFTFLFPFYGSVNIPVLRSLVNIAFAAAVTLICAVLKSYLGHRKVSRASKYRR